MIISLKYTSNYDWNDFIRLIKFFDNSLWKTIKDFIPAKVSAATGISIKQHLLERQKYPEPQASYSEPYYTGSIGQTPGLLDGQRIYTASGDYDSIPIEAITGSQGGTLPVFVENTNYTEFTYPGAVNVTQSWNGLNVTPFGFEDFTQDDAREFIDGEFSGSTIIATTGSLSNPTITQTLLFEQDARINERSDILFNFKSDEIYQLIVEATNDSLNPSFFSITDADNEGYIFYTSPTIDSGDDFIVSLNVEDFSINGTNLITPQLAFLPNGGNFFAYTASVYENVLADPNNQALFNNDLVARRSNIFWDLDYSTNAIQAVNQEAIISASQQDGNLPKAFIQDYNYYSTPILRRNYLGSKSTSPDFNELASEGGFGQLPVVQSEGYYFAFFNWVGGTSPEWGNELEDRSAVNVRYYIGEDGNVIEPINDSNGINLSIVQQGFEQDSNAILSFNDKEGATSKFTNLGGTHKIFKSGQIPQPIIYSQTESIASGSAGGYSSALTFVQGDQAQTSVDDYRLTSNANNGFLIANTTLSFPNTVVQGDEATFTTNTTFSPTSNPQTQSPKVSLTFEVYLETSLVNNFSTSTIQLKKGTSVVAQKTFNFIDGDVTLTYSDSTVTNSDNFTVFVDSVTQNPGVGPSPSINGNSYLKVTQSPPASTGIINPTYWTINNNTVTPNSLAPVYGQKQENISNSGFNPITLDFNLQIGDEFRFRGTETQAYTITSQSIQSETPVFHVDRNINLTNSEADWFLVRRYITDPSYLILEVDKPAGGTSTGVLTPEYFYGATEEKVDNILKELKKDNLI